MVAVLSEKVNSEEAIFMKNAVNESTTFVCSHFLNVLS
jgi:hypothetical protein